MQAAEGKLFKPLAFTKTFTMLAALAHWTGDYSYPGHTWFFPFVLIRIKYKKILNLVLAVSGLVLSYCYRILCGACTYILRAERVFQRQVARNQKIVGKHSQHCHHRCYYCILSYQGMDAPGCKELTICQFLIRHCYCGSCVGGALYGSAFYPRILKWALNNKWKFLATPVLIVLFGITAWQGFNKIFGFMPEFVKKTSAIPEVGHFHPWHGKRVYALAG